MSRLCDVVLILVAYIFCNLQKTNIDLTISAENSVLPVQDVFFRLSYFERQYCFFSWPELVKEAVDYQYFQQVSHLTYTF